MIHLNCSRATPEVRGFKGLGLPGIETVSANAAFACTPRGYSSVMTETVAPHPVMARRSHRPLLSRRAIPSPTAVAATLLVLTLAGCATGEPSPDSSPPSRERPSARMVDPAEFAAVIDEPNRVTVNVHAPFEGDIAGTDLSIPFDQIGPQAGRLPADRSAALAIYCRSGPMSAIAAETLRDLGYTDVVDLRGGMKAWQADGRPLTGP